jgi:hypothetical protein
MNRRGFLKGLGSLAALSLIPKGALAVTDLIEKRAAEKGPFVNHMTIQRKTVKIIGAEQSRIVWYNYQENSIAMVQHPMFDSI